jgi:hypothetical protein
VSSARLREGLQNAPVHLLLVPLPPLLAFLHVNRAMSDWTSVTFAVGATWAGELAALLVLAPLLRSVQTAAVVVSLGALLFYSSPLLGGWLGAVWVGLGLLVVVFAVLPASVRPRAGEVLTTFANLLAVLGVIMPLVTLIRDETRERTPRPAEDRFETLALPVSPRPDLPDIYYIVLDGYGGPEVLSSHFGYDSPLPEALAARGFSVAEDAHSNYIQTALSFASTLNLDYVPALLEQPQTKSKDRGALAELCEDNRVVRALRSAGYRIVEYPGEYSLTRQALADERRRPWLYFTEFEYMLATRTPLQELSTLLGLPQSWLPHQIRRHHLRYVLDALAQGDDDPGPSFTFAHIVAPHPPFVFAPDGSYRRELTRATFADGDSWLKIAKPFRESYADGYIAQVQWLDAELPRVVDGILARSPDAIVLVHGDHGPGSKLAWRNLERSDTEERSSILMAARLPAQAPLPAGLTPVNLYRVLFNVLFDAGLPLLSDRSWYSTWDTPYTFVEVGDP